MGKHNEHSHRLRDWLLYIVIGILVAASAITLGIYRAKSGQAPGAAIKWVGFAVLTLLVFWWTALARRLFWKDKRFWKRMTILAAIHLIVGISILTQVAVTSLMPFIIATPIEYYVLSALFSRMLQAPMVGGREDRQA